MIHTVKAGPFTGMKLLTDQPWNDGNYQTKVNGTYESYLYPWIEHAIAAQPAYVINVGCAEGYYAVGMALRLPETPVLAIDINPECRRVAFANARLNGCYINTTDGIGLIWPKTLIIMDCEGEEERYLLNKNMQGANIIVECHEFASKGVTSRIRSLFEGTHDILQITDPPMGDEKRPLGTSWLYLTLKK